MKDKRTRIRRSEVPVAPVRRQIQRWLDSHGYDAGRENNPDKQFSPMRKLTEIIWPHSDWRSQYRPLYRILHETEWISFDLADRIICEVLEEPWLWISDPELAEAYENVDLRGLDATKPTSPVVAEVIAEQVRETYAEEGDSITKTSRKLGISFQRVKVILESQELVCA